MPARGSRVERTRQNDSVCPTERVLWLNVTKRERMGARKKEAVTCHGVSLTQFRLGSTSSIIITISNHVLLCHLRRATSFRLVQGSDKARAVIKNRTKSIVLVSSNVG